MGGKRSALGLPAALALGLFAALAEIVPVIGPILGAVPALLLALGAGGGTFAWTVVLFVAVQRVESNLLQPLLQKRMAYVPPVLLLLSVVAVGGAGPQRPRARRAHHGGRLCRRAEALRPPDLGQRGAGPRRGEAGACGNVMAAHVSLS